METAKIYAGQAGYGCEGSLALKPQANGRPRLVVHEGGRGVDERGRGTTGHGLPLMASVSFFAVAVAVGMLLFVGGVLVQERRQAAFESTFADVSPASVTVQEGDSVWGIASRIDVDGADTAAVSRWIDAHNDLGAGPLQPGQSLVVPQGR
ncbi:LysM peptidoglycan-binding domain-containing protein [Olsenella sp. DNF00959]|uniref:LysM peptidoglycan-binding domain-containing protein n=1 Tax=Olsenella sp. DNF00959 TaxID=1476999 RepID=UPI0007852402|nr:LysM peptidoglycan-binding domain-containing protein [Olsenella sp. DNF00959]KXB62543.1 LysM domain protein [Olsenella sp. DNF00959]